MKLFKVYVIDDTEEYLELVVARDKQEAVNIVKNLEQWSCIVYMNVEEVKEVDGYKIILQPIDVKED
ncbi:MAG: hypothetical protein MSA15_20465 [Clostridium sp.]|nr:hypothetical protein [Clostridium sp.]